MLILFVTLFSQKKVEEAHVECKVEAGQKFLNSNKPLAEVESYQECMDFHLALVSYYKWPSDQRNAS